MREIDKIVAFAGDIIPEDDKMTDEEFALFLDCFKRNERSDEAFLLMIKKAFLFGWGIGGEL